MGPQALDSSTNGSAPIIWEHEYSFRPGTDIHDQLIGRDSGTDRLTLDRTFDVAGRLLSVTNTAHNGASPLPKLAFDYSLDARGLRTAAAVTDTFYPYLPTQNTWEYAYDSKGQVTGGYHRVTNGDYLPGRQFEYNFDQIGNRLQTRKGGDTTFRSGLVEEDYTVNDLNQITSRDVHPGLEVQGFASPSNVSVKYNPSRPQAGDEAEGRGDERGLARSAPWDFTPRRGLRLLGARPASGRGAARPAAAGCDP